ADLGVDGDLRSGAVALLDERRADADAVRQRAVGAGRSPDGHAGAGPVVVERADDLTGADGGVDGDVGAVRDDDVEVAEGHARGDGDVRVLLQLGQVDDELTGDQGVTGLRVGRRPGRPGGVTGPGGGVGPDPGEAGQGGRRGRRGDDDDGEQQGEHADATLGAAAHPADQDAGAEDGE